MAENDSVPDYAIKKSRPIGFGNDKALNRRPGNRQQKQYYAHEKSNKEYSYIRVHSTVYSFSD